MKTYQEYEYIIPTWTLVSLINADDSGLTDEEIKMIDQFEMEVIARHGYGHWDYPDDLDEAKYFSMSNDVHSLGDEVVDVIWVVFDTDYDLSAKQRAPASMKAIAEGDPIPKRSKGRQHAR